MRIHTNVVLFHTLYFVFLGLLPIVQYVYSQDYIEGITAVIVLLQTFIITVSLIAFMKGCIWSFKDCIYTVFFCFFLHSNNFTALLGHEHKNTQKM